MKKEKLSTKETFVYTANQQWQLFVTGAASTVLWMYKKVTTSLKESSQTL